MAASGKCDSRHNLIACTRSFIHSVTRSSGPLRKTALYPRIGIHPLSRDGPLCINLCIIRSAKITASAMMLHNYYDPIEGLTSCTSRTKPNIKLGFFVWRSALVKEQKRFWLVPVSGYTCTIFNEMSFSDTSLRQSMCGQHSVMAGMYGFG